MKTHLTWQECFDLTDELAALIIRSWDGKERLQPLKVYGVPHGGSLVALMLTHYLTCEIVETPEQASYIVVDIVDNETTKADFAQRFCGKPFYALINKVGLWRHAKLGEVVFPWEKDK